MAENEKKPAKPRRKPDARIRRTHERLGLALLTLIQEKKVDEVSVQEVLDRAGVARSTFYLHFRDTNDLLLTQLERFLEIMSARLTVSGEKSDRVAPVTEMFQHIGEQKKIYRALVESGRLNEFYELAQGYFSRGIQRRLADSPRLPKTPPGELAVRAVALAGSLLALLRWWIDRGAKEPPRYLDDLFHRMVWKEGRSISQ